MLSAHYRSPLNFSADLMEAAKNGLERILTAAEYITRLSAESTQAGMTAEEEKLYEASSGYQDKFEAAMEDDCNTADAVSAVFELVKFINTNVSAQSSKTFLQKLHDRLKTLCGILGILTDQKEEILDEEIEKLIQERQEARKNKDFARADQIRDELMARGILLKDTRQGVTWKRA